MSFLETPRFTEHIKYGATGGPSYLTEITELSSGTEHSDSKWSYPRHSYNITVGVKDMDIIEDVIAFFHAVKGRFHTFRFMDGADYKSTKTAGVIAKDDQLIGTGDSTDGSDGTAAWQLIKTYTSGALSRERLIQKPVVGTTLIAVDGILKTDGVHYNLDTTTGILTFTAGNVPLTGEAITAGYEFDVPVRFNVDGMATDLTSFQFGLTSLPLIEVKI